VANIARRTRGAGACRITAPAWKRMPYLLELLLFLLPFLLHIKHPHISSMLAHCKRANFAPLLAHKWCKMNTKKNRKYTQGDT